MNINELKKDHVAIVGRDGRATIIRDDARLRVSWTEHALAIRQAVLDLGQGITAITSTVGRDAAVAAQVAVHTFRSENEKNRKECKDPIYQFGVQIDATAKSFDLPLAAEEMRLARLVGDYEAILDQQRRAEEALRLKGLAEAERQKQEELAKATTIEQVDEIQERHNEQVRAASVPAVVPERAEGQIVRREWEIESVNEWAVLKSRPDLVRKIELDMVAIKAALARGETIAGIKAREVVKSTVRNMPRGQTLELIP